MNLILAFLCGIVAASVAWFFIWRNNKGKFNALDDKLMDTFKYIELLEKRIVELGGEL